MVGFLYNNPLPGRKESSKYSKNMNIKRQNGFAPLLVIILIAVITAAGGAVAVRSLTKEQSQPEINIAPNEQQSPVKNDSADDQSPTPIEEATVNNEEAPAPVKENKAPEPPKAEPVSAKEESVYEMRVRQRMTDEERKKKEEEVTAQYRAMEENLKNSKRDHSQDPVYNTSIPQQETYAEDSNYPIIISFEDNKGNIYKRSQYNQYDGQYGGWPDISTRTLHIGDTIRATVTAKDPKGRTIEYNWNSSSQAFNEAKGIEGGEHKYTSDNTLEYTITSADLQSAGETFRLVWQIRLIGTDHYRSGGGNKFDDFGYIDYKLIP